MSPIRTSRKRRNALAVAVHLALLSGTVYAAETPPPVPFPAYLDGQSVPATFDDPGGEGDVHHESGRLDSDVDIAVQAYCANFPTLLRCELKGHAPREVAGADGKNSAYSVLDVTVIETTASNHTSEHVIDSHIILVRSCPTDSLLVSDRGAHLENRDRETGTGAVACVSPDALPKSASLGEPRESGANQCPIGNSPTVGNPINPLTMSKIETAVDYAGPASSGLMFGRTYHSGAFPLGSQLGRAAERYPAGARVGSRWRHTYDRSFVRRPYYDDSGRVYSTALHLVREDGNETRFVRKGNTFVPAEGERGVLREDPSGGWTYTLPNLTVEHYDDKGRLRSRADANGNTLTLDYDEITVGIGLKATVLVRVRDRQGRELRLGYDRLGRMETLDTPDGRVRYDYSGDILEGLDANLVKVDYPDGRSVQYAYDEAGRGGTPNHKLTGILGGDGKRFATFDYDGGNRAIGSAHGDDLERTDIGLTSNGMISIRRSGATQEIWFPTFSNGVIRLGQRKEDHRGEDVSRTFDYVNGALVARETDYLGVPTSHQYDTVRQLEVERTEAEGTSAARTVKTAWHPVFDKPVRIDHGAAWSMFSYDAKGNLIERRDGGLADASDTSSAPWPEERVTRYTYDPAGRPLTIDGPLEGSGDTIRYAYHDADAPDCAAACTWRKGDLHTITHPLGHTATVLAYDPSGRVLSSADANGVRTDRRFDAMGRPLEVILRARGDGSASPDDLVTRMSYTANGDIDTFTDPDGATVTHRYNSAHRLIEQVDAMGHKRRIERDPQGRVGTETRLRADGTEDLSLKYTYDSRGVVEKISGSGTQTEFEVDANGALKRAWGAFNTPIYSRDARGRVIRMTDDEEGNDPPTTLSYDGADGIKTVVDPKGLSTAYLRNGLGDLLWERSPDTGDTAFENDANGQPVHESPADSRHVERSYDLGGRIATVTYHDGAKTTFAYDAPASNCPSAARFAVGRLSSVTDRDGSTSFCYDFAGRVVTKTQVTRGVRLELNYVYTKAGRLSAVVYPDGRRATYTRDAAGNVTAVDLQSSEGGVMPIVSTVHHDALGRPVGWMAGLRDVRRTYNGAGAVNSVRDAQAGGLTLDISYIGGEIDAINTGSADGYPFYDTASRVIASGFLYHTDPQLGSAHTYTYDATGNRLSWRSVESPSGATERAFIYATDSHRLLAASNVSREYDAAGNTTRIGNREFVYDSTGRMSQAKVNGVVEMNYAYNPFGQQVGRYIAGGTTVSLHDEAGHWLGDYDGAGRAIRQVVWLDGLPVAALDGDAIRDIQTDHLGTPRVVIDRATNKAIWAWDIGREAFGSGAPYEDPDKDGKTYVFDMRFPGQRYDAVTGLFQNGWRDYDPTSGRYIQSDPIGLAGGISTYAYVGSNPYVRTDPQGLDDTQCMLNRWACGWSKTPQESNVSVGVGGWGNLLGGYGSAEVGLAFDSTGNACIYQQNCGGLIVGLPVQGEVAASLGVGTGGISSGRVETSGINVIGSAGLAGGAQLLGNKGGFSISRAMIGVGGSPEGCSAGVAAVKCETRNWCWK
ncbi:MAG TPA: RHS repeat-associated core domain-containing protein [Luteibacter sp.]|uniref:RHS repeat-associated core domain-containing protein n=1 Tax=Luteibacter sp. TaxID=1886636 RepID=UPI002C555544|nr:RHS repeat-associated core domain-containing protein [Luteibacter sp.]HVI53797.1 RHS repeat-associated core domain-containing protein [Luteibacter sp.]